jgi:hypothetical protein
LKETLRKKKTKSLITMLTNTNTTTTTTTTKTDPLPEPTIRRPDAPPFASNNHDHLMVSLTLFRSDNWRSFRLLENVDMDDVDMYEDELSKVDRTEFSFVSINQPLLCVPVRRGRFLVYGSK